MSIAAKCVCGNSAYFCNGSEGCFNNPNNPQDKPKEVNPDLGICREKNCYEPATKDYNGHQHYVCDRHFEKLNDYFDEEYR